MARCVDCDGFKVTDGKCIKCKKNTADRTDATSDPEHPEGDHGLAQEGSTYYCSPSRGEPMSRNRPQTPTSDCGPTFDSEPTHELEPNHGPEPAHDSEPRASTRIKCEVGNMRVELVINVLDQRANRLCLVRLEVSECMGGTSRKIL